MYYLAGDVNHIKVGSETNIQDNTLVHVAKTNVSGNVLPTIIGNRVTIGRFSNLGYFRRPVLYGCDRCPWSLFLFKLTCFLRSSNLLRPHVNCELNLGCHVTGHNSVLHACTVEDEAFVGMGSTILDGAVVEKGAMVAAGSTVTQKTRIPTGQVI